MGLCSLLLGSETGIFPVKMRAPLYLFNHWLKLMHVSVGRLLRICLQEQLQSNSIKLSVWSQKIAQPIQLHAFSTNYFPESKMSAAKLQLKIDWVIFLCRVIYI